MKNDNDQFNNVDSFMIKIWREDPIEGAGRGTWRGVISHVPSGKRRYFEALEEMNSFLIHYLEEMGMEDD